MQDHHLSSGDVEPYRNRTLPVRELLAINDHLASCVTCRELFEDPSQLEATYNFLHTILKEPGTESEPHLSYEQIAAYTDELLNEQERKTLEIHLEGCRTCEAEVDDLQRARWLTATRLAVNSGGNPGVSTARRDRSGWFPSLPQPATVSRYKIALQLGVLIAVVATGSVITAVLLQRSLARQQALLNELSEKSEAIQNDLASSKHAVEEMHSRLQSIPDSDGGFSFDGLEGVRVALSDAHGPVTLTARGKLTGLEFVEPRDERLIAEALTRGRLRTPPSMNRLAGLRLRLMGDSPKDSFALTSPVGTCVLTNRPALRWEPLSGATAYVVTILDTAMNEVETSPALSVTEWTVTQALRQGAIYMWQVRALKEGNEIRSPSPGQGEARFRVLERSKALEVERLRQIYSGSHLALGVMYADAGLLDEAQRELEALAGVNPHAAVVKSLVRSVKKRSAGAARNSV